MIDQHEQDSLVEVLERAAAAEVKRANGDARRGQAPTFNGDGARRLIQVAQDAAIAIESQAEERLNQAEARVRMAQQWLEEAKAMAEKARSVADSMRKAGEEEASRDADRVAQFMSPSSA